MHFVNVTYTPLWFVPDEEIQEGVNTVNKYKELASQTPNGDISVTEDERNKILRGVELMYSSTNDTG